MPLAGFLAVLLISFVIGALFYFVLKNKGPWGSFWTFFVVLFLGVFLAYVWVRPVGPLYWGVALYPLVFIALLFALLLAAASPPRNRRNSRRPLPPTPSQNQPNLKDEQAELGIFFWTALILFISLLLAGIFF
mgnify:CR=1 FL=1